MDTNYFTNDESEANYQKWHDVLRVEEHEAVLARIMFARGAVFALEKVRESMGDA